VFAQQHATELLEAGGRVFRDGGEDGVALGNGEREHPRHSTVGGFEPPGECFVVNEAGELKNKVVLYWTPARWIVTRPNI
jgi:hypothetical protein